MVAPIAGAGMVAAEAVVVRGEAVVAVGAALIVLVAAVGRVDGEVLAVLAVATVADGVRKEWATVEATEGEHGRACVSDGTACPLVGVALVWVWL